MHKASFCCNKILCFVEHLSQWRRKMVWKRTAAGYEPGRGVAARHGSGPGAVSGAARTRRRAFTRPVRQTLRLQRLDAVVHIAHSRRRHVFVQHGLKVRVVHQRQQHFRAVPPGSENCHETFKTHSDL